jgi:phosphoribosylamine--glycine ligase
MPIFAPTKNAAEIESSKVFAKDLMQKYRIPCARSAGFSDYTKAKQYLEKQKLPVVIKADGLAAGKGVVVAETKQQALTALSDFMEKKSLGSAGDSTIIEEIGGQEMTFAFTDTHTTIPAVPACGYKTVFDNGKGPEYGGWDLSPPVFFSAELGRQMNETIIASRGFANREPAVRRDPMAA